MTGSGFGGVDIDLLADYIGGALAGTPDESEVAALVAGDPAWRAAYDELTAGMAAVGAELSRFGPEPMPAELAERLDAMLGTPIASPEGNAGEAAPHLTIVDAVDAPGGTADPVRGKDAGARKRVAGARSGWRSRWATPIAIAAGVLAFVGFGLDYLAGRESGPSAESSLNNTAGGAEDSAGGPAAPEHVEMFASGTDYTSATLADEPAHTMTAPRSDLSAGKASATGPVAPALRRLMAPPALDTCFAAIERENAGGPISVRSVDYASFAGSPAMVIRFSAANGYWAWATGAGCGTPAAGADTLDKVPVR